MRRADAMLLVLLSWVAHVWTTKWLDSNGHVFGNATTLFAPFTTKIVPHSFSGDFIRDLSGNSSLGLHISIPLRFGQM